ncbi:hypothetical protein D7X48_22280, partial [bacterium D16-50]
PLWDILSQRAGFGEAPQQAFLRAPAQQKFRSVATPELLAVCALPLYLARLRSIRFSYIHNFQALFF